MNVFSTDRDLIRAFDARETAAFDHIFGLYYRPLCYFSEKLTGDSVLAEDIAADSFIKLWQHTGRFETSTSIRSFLYTIVRNSSLDHLRKLKRHGELHEEIRYHAPETEEDVERLIIRSEVLQMICTAIEQLPERYREIVRRSLLVGETTEEIARSLNMAHQTVRNNKSAGIRLLRLALLEKGHLTALGVSFFLV